MRVNRRAVVFGGIAGSLSACTGVTPSRRAAAPAAPAPDIEVRQDPGFDAWVTGFRPRALSAGVSATTFDEAFRGIGFLPGVIERDRNQFQARRTLEDYIALVASDARLSEGRSALSQQRSPLEAIAARYGVPANVVTAIWGVESRYGTRRGTWPVIASLATLAYDGRRGRFFEQQLIAALKILQRGDTTRAGMTGSWAGAMGHTQFIPTTYQAYAVDFDGDGRRNIWSEDPTDALASAAAYLQQSGWRRGLPWGLEVTAPGNLTAVARSRDAGFRSFADWSAAGVRPVRGAMPSQGRAGLLRPAGDVGPSLLVGENFRALLRYNNSDSYAIAVGHLSDRLAGAGPFAADFGADAFGLTLDDRKQLQRGLTARGYDIGTIDGVIGRRTEEAIRDFQRRQGLSVDGQPSRGLLQRL